MRSRHTAASVIVVLAVFMGPMFADDGEGGSTNIEGYWQGPLKVKANLEMMVVFHVSARPDGTLTATMDVPAQRLKDIPVDKVSCGKGRLRFEVNAIPAVFEGRLERDGSVATGDWTQDSNSLPLELKRVEKPLEASGRPQEPRRPYPYDDEEVTYENKKAGIRLYGTLTLPQSSRPAPAVVLITGGGPQDRDQSVLGHKPYLVLADYLTRRGIAALRADDRGYNEIGSPNGIADFLKATIEDFAGDALAGVEYLKTRKEINPKRIGLIGHSEGGLVAPLAAVSSPDVAFVVLLAAPGQTTEEAHHDQCYFILRDAGASSKMISLAKDHYRRVFDLLRREQDNSVAEKTLHKIEEDTFAGLSKQEKEWMALLDRTMAGNPAVILSPWLRYLLAYDPKATLTNVECPVLALIGGKDVQVPAKENLPLIEQALEAGSHEEYTVKELPGLNHLFQTCKTGMPTEYGTIEETFSPVALKVVGDWVLERVKRP
jgi:fermentation-respiration switch protein FrsA (DUF1100 family)